MRKFLLSALLFVSCSRVHPATTVDAGVEDASAVFSDLSDETVQHRCSEWTHYTKRRNGIPTECRMLSCHEDGPASSVVLWCDFYY